MNFLGMQGAGNCQVSFVLDLSLEQGGDAVICRVQSEVTIM